MKSTAVVKLVVLATALSMVLVSACGPAATPTPTEVAPPTKAAEPTPTQDEEPTPTAARPTPSGTLTIGKTDPMYTLDPHRTLMMSDSAIHAQVHETLVVQDAQYELHPLLATSWEIESDTEWVFHLREGVRFHNGEPFNADTVVFNAERIKGEWGQPRSTQMDRTLDHAEKIDDYTVKFVTTMPDPVFLYRLTSFWMVSPSQVKELGDENYGQHPIGTGPFKFVEYVKDDRITLEANLDYWGEVAAIETVIYKIIPEPATRVAALMAGEVDITEIPIDSYDVVDRDPNLSAVYKEGWRTPWAFFFADSPQNPDAVALKDVRVRQAINYAVNKETIVENIFGGLAPVMATNVPSLMWGYDPSIEPYPYDPDKAKELLAEAGYPELTLNIEVPSGMMLKPMEVGQSVVKDLEAVGIHAKLVQTELGVLMGERGERREAPIVFLPWGAAFPDALEKFYYPLHSTSPVGRTADPKLDELIDAATQEMDPVKRKDVLSQAQRYVYEQAYLLFTYAEPWVFGYNNRVIGFVPRGDEKILAYGCSLAE